MSNTAWGKGRFNQTAMFGTISSAEMTARIQTLAAEEGHNRVTEVKIFHNKVILYGREILEQYTTYFSPQYLFNAGGLPYRYSVSDQGLLYMIALPLLFLAIFYLKDLEKRLGIFLLYMLMISPMPSPLTLDDVPNVHRSLFMMTPLVLLASYGLFKFMDVFKDKRLQHTILALVIGFSLLELTYFSHMYYNHANAVKSIERGDTNKEVLSDVVKLKDNYDHVYMPVHDAFPIYYLFFSQNFDKDIIGKVEKNLIVKELDNVTFIKDFQNPCISNELTKDILDKKVLIVEREDCVPEKIVQEETSSKKLRLEKVYTRHDGTTSYRIFVNN